MLEKYPQQLAMIYHITLDPVDTAETVMEKIGTARGCVKAGGVLDLNKVEQMVLYEFKTAKMGRFTLDEPK
jgi:ribosome biogenesis GTPase A